MHTRTNRQTNEHTSFTQVRLSGVASFRCKQGLPPDTSMPSPDRRRKKFRKLHIHKIHAHHEICRHMPSSAKQRFPPCHPPNQCWGRWRAVCELAKFIPVKRPPVEDTTKASNATLILGGAGGAAHTIWIRKLHEIYLTCEISSVNSHP